MAEIPERLKINGRAADQHFDPAEKIYRRYARNDYEIGVVLNIGLSSAPSVNREKFSHPKDVLLSTTDEYEGLGVLSIAVQDIPAQLLIENPSHRFFPQHVPEENNYAHSEVWCNRIGQVGPHIKPSNLVKKMFRTLLGQRVSVEIQALK
ncbi:MAG TPA: hypothetical protein VK709_02025 [Candidatus Saccharimonadales bacterium]|jgi:hypothetical protein|nr:hypothetical protein [Candidatus Saccharimonadales bacterium]